MISEDNYLENVGSGVPMSAANAIWSSKPAVGTIEQFSIDKQQSEFPAFCYNCWYYLTVEI
jgi:hypothetical protein